ncbi:uncharacterized protein LOC132729432 [Ruditapes philippinarum]|uniref:uncharacterized protein LOC132729432 n=1 Tax=Ruditapes philippinarum TaxID=129788 RepID=UPI00295BB8F8|nr:uncharacterized protein LOC132729432 [Ruditapes philippinarum]
MEVMPNYHQESSVNSSPQVSNEDYTVIITETTGVTDPDEFVLDLTTLPLDSDDIFNNISASNETIPPHNHIDSGNNLAKGIKRSLNDEDDVTITVDDEIESSGYESDSEHGEDISMLNRKKKKIKRNKNNGKCFNIYIEKKTFLNISDLFIKSLIYFMPHLLRGGLTLSVCSVVTMTVQFTFHVLDRAYVKAGPSMSPSPIFRTSRTIQPLYKKLLNVVCLACPIPFYQTCCSGECYRDWARKRVTIARMVRDYAESDLRVDYFSWGKWKQEPEVDVSGSSDEDWF